MVLRTCAYRAAMGRSDPVTAGMSKMPPEKLVWKWWRRMSDRVPYSGIDGDDDPGNAGTARHRKLLGPPAPAPPAVLEEKDVVDDVDDEDEDHGGEVLAADAVAVAGGSPSSRS